MYIYLQSNGEVGTYIHSLNSMLKQYTLDDQLKIRTYIINSIPVFK